ncbi:phospho-N-acetylmuramoyl-pentapeptide-transferase [Patescibacteria group bacterium]|nr:phospho-N-acetylmuramoyl-pentapeptide-transferase [Patescibacteria group bacterium]MBU0964636.1 phospho-N-acetylmuramoyl-pentapeptide-transferase [Patescibacteria group bacterium]
MGLEENFDIIKIFFLTTVAFVITIFWTPVLSHFLYKYKLGKKIRKESETPIYSQLHRAKSGTPTMGGIIIWLTVFFMALLFYVLSKIIDIDFIKKLNFLTRPQTLLPLGALMASALIGLFDDLLNIRGVGTSGGGLRIRYKLFFYILIAIFGAYWFYFKLDWTTIHVPFMGNFDIGIWYIPIFIFIIVATAFSVNETDGLDGLAGGTLLSAFGAFGAIAFAQGKFELATFCGVIIGALLAFMWFNINPARFFMGDTGSMSLGVTLGIVAMLTNSALLLPVIGFILVLESGSVIIQIVSKKVFKKKVFLSAPLHHHFEARGWPEPKIVMRFWIIAGVTAVIGVILFLIDK